MIKRPFGSVHISVMIRFSWLNRLTSGLKVQGICRRVRSHGTLYVDAGDRHIILGQLEINVLLLRYELILTPSGKSSNMHRRECKSC